MAGQSSGQMTKAQYHRAVSAQNQSKVGDQWAFFQAKRIRGTQLEMALLSLRATFGQVPISPESLLEFAMRLVSALTEALGKARTLASTEGVDPATKGGAERLAGALEKQLK